MPNNFFVTALREAMSARRFNQAQLAEFLSVDPAYVSRWLHGSNPRVDVMMDVLRKLDWRMDRARPGYDPFRETVELLRGAEEGSVKETARAANRGSMTAVLDFLNDAAHRRRVDSALKVCVCGQVNASDGSLCDAAGAEELRYLHELLPPETDASYLAPQLCALRVTGGALPGVCPEEGYLLARDVRDASQLPGGALVVVESEGGLAIRRLMRVTGARGAPDAYCLTGQCCDEPGTLSHIRETAIRQMIVAVLIPRRSIAWLWHPGARFLHVPQEMGLWPFLDGTVRESA